MSSVAFCSACQWSRRIDCIYPAAAGLVIFGSIICPSGQVCLQVQRETFLPVSETFRLTDPDCLDCSSADAFVLLERKKSKKYSVPRGGGRGGVRGKTLVCTSSRPHSAQLHIDVFQMISRAHSSGHGWKANLYFSVSVQGPGVAGSPARSPSVFLRPPHSLSLVVWH